MPSPIPPCTTTGLIDLCQAATTIVAGAKVDGGQPWFLIQVPNLIWFVALATLLVLAIVVPLPTRPIAPPRAGPDGE
jgi:hypothetical protein